MQPGVGPGRARRRLLKAGAWLLSGAPMAGAQTLADPWAEADAIAAECTALAAFPARDFSILAYGALPCALAPVLAWTSMVGQARVPAPAPGAPDCRPALRAAIAACRAAGGGRVLVPPGDWYCAGPVELFSHVHLHLQAGAHLYFTTDPAAYAKEPAAGCVQSPGAGCTGYYAMIHARGQRHLALTGEDWSAVLDGQGGVAFAGSGDSWWSWHAEPAPPGAPRRNFGKGFDLRPAMLELVDCSDVLLEGYQIANAPGWVQHPVDCRRLALRRVYVNSHGPNNDGFDPESCDTVLVEGCSFNTRDDCIAIKSGKGIGRAHAPSRRILVQDCLMYKGVGGITFGSETAGGIEQVFVRRIGFRDAFLNAPILFKTNMNRGSHIRHIYIRDIDIPAGIAPEPRYYASQRSGFPMPAPRMPYWKIGVITIDCNYAATRAQPVRVPTLSDIHISGVRVGNPGPPGAAPSCWQAIVVQGPVAANYTSDPAGTRRLPIERVSISDCDFGWPANRTHPYEVYEPAGVRITDFQLRRVRIDGVPHDVPLPA
jgi:polygalacturonase